MSSQRLKLFIINFVLWLNREIQIIHCKTHKNYGKRTFLIRHGGSKRPAINYALKTYAKREWFKSNELLELQRLKCIARRAKQPHTRTHTHYTHFHTACVLHLGSTSRVYACALITHFAFILFLFIFSPCFVLTCTRCSLLVKLCATFRGLWYISPLLLLIFCVCALSFWCLWIC